MYIAREGDLLSARVYIRPSQSEGGRVYEIKILCSNLALEEGGGRLLRGVYNRASTVLELAAYSATYVQCVYRRFNVKSLSYSYCI